MQELLLVNPRKRRKKKSSAKRRSKRRASPAQIAARKKFAAMARSGAFKKRRRRKGGRSKARRSSGRKHRYRTARPSARLRRRRAKNTQKGYFPNPGKRRRRRRARSLTLNFGGSMARRHRRRRSSARRHNPINFGNAVRRPMNFIQPALWGAVGAITVNTFMSRVVPLVLPANLQVMFMTGRLRYLTQGAAAIAVGMLAQRFGVKAAIAQRMAEGSLTVTLTDAIRDVAMSVGVPLGGIGYYLPGRNAGNAVPSASGAPGVQMHGMRGMNAYVTGPGSIPGNVTPMRRSSMSGMGFGPSRTF